MVYAYIGTIMLLLMEIFTDTYEYKCGEYPGYSLLPLHTAFNPSHLPLPLKSTLNWTIN